MIPLIELLYSGDNQGHARERGIGAIWTVTDTFTRILYENYHED